MGRPAGVDVVMVAAAATVIGTAVQCACAAATADPPSLAGGGAEGGGMGGGGAWWLAAAVGWKGFLTFYLTVAALAFLPRIPLVSHRLPFNNPSVRGRGGPCHVMWQQLSSPLCDPARWTESQSPPPSPRTTRAEAARGRPALPVRGALLRVEVENNRATRPQGAFPFVRPCRCVFIGLCVRVRVCVSSFSLRPSNHHPPPPRSRCRGRRARCSSSGGGCCSWTRSFGTRSGRSTTCSSRPTVASTSRAPSLSSVRGWLAGWLPPSCSAPLLSACVCVFERDTRVCCVRSERLTSLILVEFKPNQSLTHTSTGGFRTGSTSLHRTLALDEEVRQGANERTNKQPTKRIYHSSRA